MRNTMPLVAAAAGPKAKSEDGVTILEYVLILALVSLVAVGALVYFDKGGASPSEAAQRAASNLGVGISGGNGTSPAPPSSDWCTSRTASCTDTIAVSTRQTIHFWASGGIPPYSASLTGAPRFVDMEGFDTSTGSGEVAMGPKDCSEAGSYEIGITVNDSERPPSTGTLRFSLTVPACSSPPGG